MAEEAVKDINHIHPLPDFVQGGLDYLPSEFLDDRFNFINTLTIFLERLKAVDEAAIVLAEKRTLLTAEGVNLDEIGQQAGIYRNGLGDNEYRAVIMILSGNTAKSGTRDDVIGTLKQIFGEEGFTTWKGHNYRFDINVTSSCFDIDDVISQIVDMMPLTTHLRVVESMGQAFGFNNDSGTAGFGSVSRPSVAGNGGIASVVYTSDDNEPY